MAIVVVPFVAVNLAAYRSVLPPYYSGTRLGSEASIGFVDAASMYLFSPSRGLLIYDPVVVLAVVGVALKIRRRRFSALDGAVCAAVVGHWLVIASFGSSGGSSYGPRYMTDVLPFLVYLAIPAVVAIFGDGWRVACSRRIAVGIACVLLGWSVVVNASGAVLRSAYRWSATPVQVDDRPSRDLGLERSAVLPARRRPARRPVGARRRARVVHERVKAPGSGGTAPRPDRDERTTTDDHRDPDDDQCPRRVGAR